MNLLAYVERFGWFDADVAVLVLSTHDLEDVPEFRDRLGVDFPTERPRLALEELARRYLPRYVPALADWLGAPPSPPTVRYDDTGEDGYKYVGFNNRIAMNEVDGAISKLRKVGRIAYDALESHRFSWLCA